MLQWHVLRFIYQNRCYRSPFSINIFHVSHIFTHISRISHLTQVSILSHVSQFLLCFTMSLITSLELFCEILHRDFTEIVASRKFWFAASYARWDSWEDFCCCNLNAHCSQSKSIQTDSLLQVAQWTLIQFPTVPSPCTASHGEAGGYSALEVFPSSEGLHFRVNRSARLGVRT